MLLNFRVANFRSLKEPQELDLRSVYRDQPSTLTVAALYGANASGKSNMLLALEFMHDAVTDRSNWSSSDQVHVLPFRLDRQSSDLPTSFSVDLELDGIRYTYGFSANTSRILDEWLHWYPKKKKRVVFEREADEYYFGPTYASARATLLTELTEPTKLYITSAARAKDDVVSAVAGWFRESLWFLDNDEESREMQRTTTLDILRNPNTAASAQILLRAADLGIQQALAEEIEFEYEQVTGGADDGEFTIRVGPNRKTTILYSGKRPTLTAEMLNQLQRDLVTFQHRGEVAAEFPIRFESRGTQSWFDLVGPLIRTLSKGWTLVVDELDTSLHPLLLAQMVRLFQNPDTNRNGAQLIFTTHDASLMGRPAGEELLRRDEIWFTEKNQKTGASSVYPLTDFKPRSGLNWEKRYLGGAVGAVPYVDSELFEGAMEGRTIA